MKIFTHRRFKVVGLAIAIICALSAFVWLVTRTDWFVHAFMLFIAFLITVGIANVIVPGDPKEPKPPEKTYDNVSRD